MSIGGRNTAKRKIQVRKFVSEQFRAVRSFSNPFLDDDNGAEDCLKPKESAITFGVGKYVPDDSEESESDDQILSKKVNLDEADRFMAALRLPRTRSREDKMRVAIPMEPLNLEKLEIGAEMMRKVRLRESQGEMEEEEETESDSESDKICAHSKSGMDVKEI